MHGTVTGAALAGVLIGAAIGESLGHVNVVRANWGGDTHVSVGYSSKVPQLLQEKSQ
jgi:hypothetical protein